jgi:signal transduction histidine kinase
MKWWRVPGLPTTKAGVERAFSYFVAGVRLGTLAQMIPAVHAGVTTSPHHVTYLACWVAAALASVAGSVVTLVRRRPLGAAASAADFALACLLLVLGPLVLLPDERFGTWVAFQPAYALSIIITASGVRSLVFWSGGLLSVVVCYVVYLGGAAADREMIPTAVGNVLTYVVYALVTRMFYNYTRRIARDADDSRARAAELGRREEERRAQVMMHNGVAVMRLLTEPASDAERSRLIDVAEVELQRMRAYLRGRTPSSDLPVTADSVELASMIQQVCDRFADLHIDALLDLGTGVRISAAQAEAVERALDSLLFNVRGHAQADGVVVHLDQDADRWTLTIRDDGIGYDQESVSLGVGLREVVIGELRRRGLAVDIESAPGDGTTVTITSTPGSSDTSADRDALTEVA